MIDIFDFEMTNDETFWLREGEKLYHIYTKNSMDSLWFTDSRELGDEELEGDVRRAMRRKRGGDGGSYEVVDESWQVEEE